MVLTVRKSVSCSSLNFKWTSTSLKGEKAL
jgi:hypothetical protein